jgi:hypothetical protein
MKENIVRQRPPSRAVVLDATPGPGAFYAFRKLAETDRSAIDGVWFGTTPLTTDLLQARAQP